MPSTHCKADEGHIALPMSKCVVHKGPVSFIVVRGTPTLPELLGTDACTPSVTNQTRVPGSLAKQKRPPL
jgi:hypothetical protein